MAITLVFPNYIHLQNSNGKRPVTLVDIGCNFWPENANYGRA